MTIDYPAILERVSAVQTWRWDEREAIIYALSLGLGSDPTDERAPLPFVYEKDLKVVPTLPTVLAWIAEPTFTQLGVDPLTALHGEQKIELHRSLVVRADQPLTVRIQGRVLAVHGKGHGRGAVVITEHRISDASDDLPLATLTTTCFGRSEGGCGGSSKAAPPAHALPSRPPDRCVVYPTRPDLALLYRLTGDRNPIHAEPAVAQAGGFERPILHGLCSFGLCCRAVLETYADYDPERIASQQARFSAPVYPGDTLSVDLWRDGNDISFQARVAERQSVVLKNGLCRLR